MLGVGQECTGDSSFSMLGFIDRLRTSAVGKFSLYPLALLGLLPPLHTVLLCF